MTQMAVGKTAVEQQIETARKQVDHDVAMLGFTDIDGVPDLLHLRITIVGQMGSGKSRLWQFCPDALIINTDTSPLSLDPGEKLRARMWPVRRKSDGRPVEPNPQFPHDPEKGTPIEKLTWERILGVKDKLIELAARNAPGRPKAVVLDTVDMAVDMVQQYLADKANKDSFNDLYIDKWNAMYSQFDDFATQLHRAGYGVILVMHLGDKQITLNEKEKLHLHDVTLLPGNMWNYLRNFTDIVGAVIKERVETDVFADKLGPDGKPLIDPRTKRKVRVATGKKTAVTKVWLAFEKNEKADMPGIIKARASLPSLILLPKNDPWGAFEAAYRKATSPPPTTSPEKEPESPQENETTP